MIASNVVFDMGSFDSELCPPYRLVRSRIAGGLHARLRFGRVQRIFQDGLHGLPTAFIAATAALGDEIERFYMA